MSQDRFALNAAERGLFRRAEEIAEAWTRAAAFPLSRSDLLAIYAELEPTGYLSSTLRPAVAGDNPALGFAALVEGLSPALPLLGNHSVQRYIDAFGTAHQKREFLPPLLSGCSIAAIAITELQAGGDLNKIGTTAVRRGDRFTIDGVKTWVTHGMVADVFIVLAKTEAGFSRFIVPGASGGLERQPLNPVGLKHLTFAELRLNRCEVPVDSLLGAEGEGAEGAKSAFPIARALAALQAVRLGEAALAVGTAFAKDRNVFGQRLSQSALIQSGLADLQAQLAGARLLAYATMADLGTAGSVASSSLTKAQGCQAALSACRWSMELLGSAALDERGPLERLYRDAQMMAVVDGTIALNRFVAGRHALRG